MFRALVIAAPMVVASLTVVPVASPALAWQNGNAQCGNSEERRARGRGIGGMLGGMARGLGGRMGGVAGMVMNNVPVAEMLGEAIASLLDQCEQQKAAVATDEAIRGGNVGTTVNWESESRPGVRGSSTVTAVENNAPDGDCMTVTDIVIVDGEETRAPKRMCRRPPNNRYVRV